MNASLGETLLQAVTSEFRRQKKLAEDAIAQLSPQEWTYAPGQESNSIAVLMKHVGGNLRSRWTDFLTTDGEKPDRDRDAEFEAGERDTPETLRAVWEAGWSALFHTLESLKDEDLLRTVTIRGEPHSVPLALERSLAHTAYHVGQIVYLAKMLRDAEWRTLSIPRRPRPR
ncbi:MAG: DUF1572 family protein [Firmicutes bacterium]|nr:DUF1572 family protein [Bacillota bacterium]